MKKASKRAIEVGLGAAAIAGAATYFFTGKDGAKNRKKVGAWAAKAKKEVIKEIKGMGTVSQKSYNKAVDVALANYKNLKDIDKSEVLALAKELKKHWTGIQKDVKKLVNKKAPAKKKAAKKSK